MRIHRATGCVPSDAAGGAAAAALALLLGGAAPLAHAQGAVLRDDLGRDVVFARAPTRIISLLPSITETICALGACDRLVATDRFSDWPAEVQRLPKTGGLEDPQIESMVRLHPDLVLISDTQRITERLGELGVRTFALSTERYAAIARTVSAVGAILDLTGRAALLNRQIASEVRAVSAEAAARRRGAGPSVYFEEDRTPYAAGPSSFIGELLTLLGARNIVSADLGPFPRLNPEYVVRRNPDVIIAQAADEASLAERPGWSEIRAVKEHRLCFLSQAQRDTVVRPGPRVAEGMRALADCLERAAP